MAFAANAVTDLIAPAPPPAHAAARDDDGPAFQDHLDAQSAADTKPDASAAQAPDRAKPAKASKSSAVQTNTAAPHADAAPSDNTSADAQPTAPPGAKPEETPAHAVIVQVVVQTDGQEAKPPTPEAPPQAAPQPAPTAPAPAPAVAEAAAAHVQPPVSATPTTPAPQKSGKSDTKPSKADATPEKPEATKQSDSAPAPTQAIAQPVTPAAPPTPQAVPLAATPDTSATPAAKDDAGVAAVQSNGKSAAAPKPHTPAPAAPQAAAQPDAPSPDTGKSGEPKANATRAAKAAVTATGAKTANASGADFSALVRTAAAHSEPSAAPSALSSAGGATSIQAAATDPSAIDIASARAAAAPVSAQVAREIVRRANGDNTRFELRLDPPELGKIQVQLDVSRDHKVTAVVSADNPQALSDLTRGARDLQQALQSAGLQLADDGLSFNLSNQNHGFSQPDQSNTNGGNPGSAQRGLAAENQSSADTSSARARPLSIESWRGARIDVMA